FWSMSLINWRGIKTSARFSTFCAFAGSLLPMAIIICLGFIWLGLHKPLEISLSAQAMIPSLHQHGASHMWVALTGIMLSFCGMEIATVHGANVKNPQRTYPIAMLISTLIIILTLVFGSLAIAIVIPANKISLVAGIMEAFYAFFHAYHLAWILPLVALFLIIGGLGSVNNWIIAPTRGLLYAAQDGLLPNHLSKTNANNAPANLLWYQAIIVTILCSVFLLLPSVNASYWLLTALAAQLYMFMYILMFAAAIVLRFKFADKKRPYAIPGGILGMIIVAGIGIIGAILTVVVGFIPPSNIRIGSTFNYESLLIFGLIIMSLPPLILAKRKYKPSPTLVEES
ncbi:MAG: amino acid permease, partial [Pseudomonadota bacterium]